jgi:hypothetical protein
MTQSRVETRLLTERTSWWRHHRVRLALGLTLVCAISGLAAADRQERVVVLLGKSYPQYQQVAAAFSQEWKESRGVEPEVLAFPADPAQREQLLSRRPTLVVGLGEHPTAWALDRNESFDLAFTLVVGPERLTAARKPPPSANGRLIGVSIEVPDEKQLEILLRVFPNLKRIGVVTHDRSLDERVAHLQNLCAKHQLTLVHKRLASMTELPAKLGELFGQADLLWSLPDSEVFQPQLARYVIVQCAERNTPLVGLSATFVKSGATISFDPDYQEVGRLLARQCLTRAGDSPTDLPVASPQRIVVSINQRAFDALKLTKDFQATNATVVKY